MMVSRNSSSMDTIALLKSDLELDQTPQTDGGTSDHKETTPLCRSGETRSTAHDLSVPGATLFIVGKVTGVGILILPIALNDTGIVYGLIIAIICLIGTTYSGIRLAQNWNILTKLDPRYLTEINRNPYAEMALKAFGPVGRKITNAILYVYIFALCVTDLIVLSENTSILLSKFHVHVSLCVCLPIVTLTICPITWFGTPKDFWLVGLTSALTSVIATVVIITSASIDFGAFDHVDQPVDFWKFFAAIGLIGYSFAGQSVFPTLQHDMKDPTKFSKSVLLGYASIASMYFPSSILAVVVYRPLMVSEHAENITDLFSSSVLSVVVILAINIHLLLAIVIFTNTLYQDLEQTLNVPYDFNWKRCAVRSGFMLLSLMMAASIPSFQSFLSIFGGMLTALVNFLLPLGIYVKLCKLPETSVTITNAQVAINILVMTFAVLLGASSSISGIYNVVNNNGTTFAPPCYLPR